MTFQHASSLGTFQAQLTYMNSWKTTSTLKHNDIYISSNTMISTLSNTMITTFLSSTSQIQTGVTMQTFWHDRAHVTQILNHILIMFQNRNPVKKQH